LNVVASNALPDALSLSSNYHITYANGDLTINTRDLTITANNRSKTYGTVLSLGTSAFTTNGTEANTEHVTAVTLTSSSGADASTTAPAGTYPGDIVATHATGPDDLLAALYPYPTTVEPTINTRDLTVTANNRSKTYGDVLALGTSAFTTNGTEANTEHVTAVTLTSTAGVAGSTTAAAGSYPGNVVASNATGTGGFLASNYHITYTNGDLTINTRDLTITAN